jgi:hypothetical protein
MAGQEDGSWHFRAGTGEWVANDEHQPMNRLGYPIVMPPQW